MFWIVLKCFISNGAVLEYPITTQVSTKRIAENETSPLKRSSAVEDGRFGVQRVTIDQGWRIQKFFLYYRYFIFIRFKYGNVRINSREKIGNTKQIYNINCYCIPWQWDLDSSHDELLTYPFGLLVVSVSSFKWFTRQFIFIFCCLLKTPLKLAVMSKMVNGLQILCFA